MSYEYQYAQLATNSTIRLIKLEEKVNNTITCTICHVDRNEQPDFVYDALSYVWGDATPTRYIYLIDSEGSRMSFFPVHENLWRFLNWAMDSGFREFCSCSWIWTDRICLNQEDGEEIAQQIPMMGDIFRNAERVFAWLGVSQEELEYLIPSRHESLDASVVPLPEENPIESKETNLDVYQKRVALIRGNPYWRRIWVIQEIVSAKELLFLIGDTVFWEFQPVFRFLNPYFQTSRGPDMTYLWRMRCSQGKSELADLLMAITSSDYETGRPHDRVYGLLGLVSAHDDGTSPLEYIDVDYNKSPWDVILDAVLESRPYFNDYPLLVENLLMQQRNKHIQQPVLECFKSYLCSDRTSERHLELARLALQACEALQIFSSALGADEIYRLIRSILIDVENTIINGNFEPTIQDRAFALGLALALKSSDEQTSDCESGRSSRPMGSSSWRCNAHQSRVDPTRATNEHLRGEWSSTIEWSFDETPQFLVDACAEYSADEPRSCDGRAMTFEIPEAGLRLMFQSLVKEWFEYDLEIRLQFLQTDSTGLGGSKSASYGADGCHDETCSDGARPTRHHGSKMLKRVRERILGK
ncbi:heterokaryon incompatibility protein-domain-containing protein [Phyllosticta capitalensis]|uniref:heterokaryon incompatibility protein-domain-containing protein n=1 Tax=Phyllosticta capitalensis TaxID=121624 RepID=UPI00312DD77B